MRISCCSRPNLFAVRSVDSPDLLLILNYPTIALPSGPVGDIYVDSINERILGSASSVLHVPTSPHERVEWGFKDESLRLFVDRKVATRGTTH